MNDYQMNIDDFKNKKIIVLGDVMLDKSLFGEVVRISPEAPIPIVKIKGEPKLVPGGAANTASNISSLGAKVLLFGVVGDDGNAQSLGRALKEAGIENHLVKDADRPTITKTRVFGSAQGHQQQIIRLDQEEIISISSEIEDKLISALKVEIESADAVVLSDYAKGTLTVSLAETAIHLANENHKIIIVDAKPQNIGRFKRCTLATPNIHEAEQIVGSKDMSLEAMANKIKELMECKQVIITLGKEGMYILNGGGKLIPTKAKEILDVTGAGDTVVGTLALPKTRVLVIVGLSASLTK